MRHIAFSLVALAVPAIGAARAEIAPAAPEKPLVPFVDMRGVAGNYLAGRFAQGRHDWDRAASYLGGVLRTDPDNPDLLRRAMVLAMGAGQVEDAFAFARKLGEDAQAGSLASLFLAVESFGAEDYGAAAQKLGGIAPGGMTEFLTPLLEGWAQAGLGVYEVKSLPDNGLGAYHAVLIAYAMDRKSEIPPLVAAATGGQGLPARNLERIADICLDSDLEDKALELYKELQAGRPDDPALARKIAQASGEAPSSGAVDRSFGLTPRQGAAEALFDMAGILFGEYSDDSARVFARMALYLDPSIDEASALLAHIAARNERYDEAIRHFQAIDRNDEAWAEAQRRAADLMERAGRRADALGLLNMLVKERGDIEARIQIGDLHRRAESFVLALEAYDGAIRQLGARIPDVYWHLLYARGMTYERLGKWREAERDLLAALDRQPEHPYILNYLGYGWADRGENLERALGLLEKAAALRPSDGYIADSLGWALFRLGRYADAVAPMERAVAILPDDPVINDHLGDVYHAVGRKMEARFQWQRALNFSTDKALSAAIRRKLDGGAEAPGPALSHAGSSAAEPGKETGAVETP